MSLNSITLLPEKVANQIAAGEVVQRPASVVKELLENSLDSGADYIQLIIKDAGRTLIQVIDNGCGMNEIDARMSFERHATSKIKTAEDLFSVVTMGFRGEALASIASVAQVEMKTKTHDNDLGVEIRIEGTKYIHQQACQCATGTSIAVKNLFFNIPARRNFLKTDNIEQKHIYDEFHRIALANPNVKFVFIDNNISRFSLEKVNLKQRIVQIFGSTFQKKLVPVDQTTEYLRVHGYLIKPEFAKKTRGEQFLFVNNRFIKNFSLHKTVAETYKNYITAEMVPGYFLFFDISPQEIDVNVHPTKTEIKFKHDNVIKQILQTSLKYSIGSFNIAPSIDFDIEQSMNFQRFDPNKPIIPPQINVNPNYNPFQNSNSLTNKTGFQLVNFNEVASPVFSDEDNFKVNVNQNTNSQLSFENIENQQPKNNFLFANSKYIITLVKSGVMFIDTNAAYERIVFEQTKETLNSAKTSSSQQLLFPETFELSTASSLILLEIIPELDCLGFNISNLGNNTFSCSSTPAGWESPSEIVELIEQLIEMYQHHLNDGKNEKNLAIALSVSKKSSIKSRNFSSNEEMNAFIEQLFSTPMPEISPSGNKTYWILEYNELKKLLSKS